MKPFLLHALLAAGLALPASLAHAQATKPVDGGNKSSHSNQTKQPHPQATTKYALGEEDTLMGAILEGVYGAHTQSQFAMTITALPKVGTLYQFDTTPITTVPTLVTDTEKRVWYVPPADQNGTPLASFSYKVKSLIDFKESFPQDVALWVLTVADSPVLDHVTVEFVEDTIQAFQLGLTDIDLDHEGDAFTTWIDTVPPPKYGNLHQVEEDCGSPGEKIESGMEVTHPDRLVIFVPGPDFCGATPAFEWSVQDACGLTASSVFEFVGQPVNDAPRPENLGFGMDEDDTVLYMTLFTNDHDTEIDDILIVIPTLPTSGLLYHGSIDSNKLIEDEDAYFAGEPLIYVKSAGSAEEDFDEFTFYAYDGQEASEVRTVSITVYHQNQPPQFDPIAPITILEDSAPVPFTVTATDPDGPNPEAAAALSIRTLPTHGTVQVRTPQGSWVDVTSPGTQVDGYAPAYLRYISNRDANTFESSPDVLSVQILEGDVLADAMDIQFAITPVNDAPRILGPSDDNARITFPAMQRIPAIIDTLTVIDDAVTGLDSVTLSATNAFSLTLTSTAGLMNFRQVDATTIRFDGTVQAINQALATGVVFSPLTYGLGSVTMTINDHGNTGHIATELTATHTINIAVTP